MGRRRGAGGGSRDPPTPLCHLLWGAIYCACARMSVGAMSTIYKASARMSVGRPLLCERKDVCGAMGDV